MLLVLVLVIGILERRRPGVAESVCVTNDTEAPEITINGEMEITLNVGDSYEDAGAEAVDDCEAAELSADGVVNTTEAGTYNITYSARDQAGNIASVKRVVNVTPGRGVIYLTFDDGPGPYTAELLDILKQHNVKATFFVTGAGDDGLILREYQEGHTVGLHSLSHDYGYIYSSTENYWADLLAVQARVKNITGETSYIMRFPGGSSNLVSARYDGGSKIMSKLVDEVTGRGFVYFDWSISSGDAGGASTADEVYARTVNALKDGANVILQHDIKGFSVEAVGRIIEYGKSHGFAFAPLTKSSFTAHHGVNN